MQIFLDSSNPKDIATACEWGIIDGVTTNPSLICKGGPDMQATLQGVVKASPGPVLCQAIGWDDKSQLIGQAKWLHAFSDNIIVKLPMSVAGIMALKDLKRCVPGIRIAVTMVSSVAQALICGKVGADIVALFNGPLDTELDQPVELVGPVRRIYANYGIKTKILSCGRFPRAFGQYAVEGSDICTLRFEFLKLMYEHAYTDKRFTGFMRDWNATFGENTWPRI